MGAREDLTGQRFSKLVVQKDTGMRESNAISWQCLCDCGNTTHARGSDLKNKRKVSCGCVRRLGDLTGVSEGFLTCIAYLDSKTVQLKCQCANIVSCNIYDFINGKVKSCGCYNAMLAADRMRLRVVDITGQKFNRLTVVSRSEEKRRGNVCWNVKCDCGAEFVIKGTDVRHGRVKSCGCLLSERVSASNKARAAKQVQT